MKQNGCTTNNIFIYRHESQTSQLLPAKSHNLFQSSQGTLKVMKHQNDDAKPLWIRLLTPLHLPQTPSPAMNTFTCHKSLHAFSLHTIHHT